MAILVLGGAGYIGSHTVLSLLEAGHSVLVADNFVNSKPEVLRRLEEAVQDLAVGGLTDAEFLRHRKAFYGASLRALDSFEDMCVSLAESRFAGSVLLDQYALIETITADEVRSFIARALAPEKLVLSVVCPKNAGN